MIGLKIRFLAVSFLFILLLSSIAYSAESWLLPKPAPIYYETRSDSICSRGYTYVADRCPNYRAIGITSNSWSNPFTHTIYCNGLAVGCKKNVYDSRTRQYIPQDVIAPLYTTRGYIDVRGRIITATEYNNAISNTPYMANLWCQTKFNDAGFAAYSYDTTNTRLYTSSVGGIYYLNAYGTIGCAKLLTCLPENYLDGKCCTGVETFNNLEDNNPLNPCCYKGVVVNSDASTTDGNFVCYGGQLYGLSEKITSDNKYAVPFEPGCMLKNEGSIFYYTEQDRTILVHADTESNCILCGGSTWVPQLGTNGLCCGDDGIIDTGMIYEEDTQLCYKGSYMFSQDEPFAIKPAEDILPTNKYFAYDLISNAQNWHICDANSNVADTKLGVQLSEGEHLQIPTSIATSTYVQNTSQTTGQEEGSDDFNDMLAAIGAQISDIPTEQTDTELLQNYEQVSQRFICSKEDQDSKFLECCGLNYDNCINQGTNRVRLAGSFMTTIKEFIPECDKQFCPQTWKLKTDESDDFYYFRISLNNAKESPLLNLMPADSNINDWSTYDSLDFYVYATDDLNLQLFIGGEYVGDSKSYGRNYRQEFLGEILNNNYALNGAGLNKWMHISIPTSQITTNSDINFIEFRVDKNAAKNDGRIFSIGANNYYNLFAIDKIHLVKANNDFVCGTEAWVDSLDSDQFACESVPGYKWSGNKCCGNDPHEYYQDGNNYCWNGNLLKPGDAVTDIDSWESEDADLLYGLDNQFYSCSRRSSISKPGIGLITAQLAYDSECNTFMYGHVCSPNGKWSKELYGLPAIEQREMPKDSPDQNEQVCCAKNQCWTEKKCLNAASGIVATTSPEYIAGGNWGDPVLSACVLDQNDNGNWQEVYRSISLDNSEAYCPILNTCWDGQQCVFEGAYSRDHFCSAGAWSTRTKILATKMLEWANDNVLTDFSLYCDKSAETLPYTEYEPLQSFLQDNGSNNYCILRSGSRIILGTTLNEDKLNPFMNVVSLSCSFAQNDDDTYKMCNDNNPQLWYNSKMNSIIYSKEGILGINPESDDITFNIWLKAPYDTTIYILKNIIKPISRTISGTIDYSAYLKETTDYDRVYLARYGDKEIFGFIDQSDPAKPYLSVDYKNFKTDICRNAAFPEVFCQPIIDTTAGKTYADYKLYSFASTNLPEIWQSATSMLRLKSITLTGLTPNAAISSPTPDFIFADNDQVRLATTNPQEEVTYYWDIEPGDVLNGQFKGNDYSMLGSVFGNPGPHKITLIAISNQGKYSTAEVNVIKQ